LALCDISFERAVLDLLAHERVEITHRCLTPQETLSVAPDHELWIDPTFHRRHGGEIHRPYRVLADLTEVRALLSPVNEPAHVRGPVYCFVGSTGGAGATTTALYSAVADQALRDILVIDADLWHPSASVFVSAAPKSLITALDWVDRGGSLREAAAPWEERVWVLSGIDSSSRRQQLNAENFRALVLQAQRDFDEVRIDVGAHLADDHPVIEESVRLSERCVLLTEAHPASVVHARAAHDQIVTHGGSTLHVLNRMSRGPIPDTAHRIFTATFGRDPDLTIPDDLDAHRRAFIDGSALTDRRQGPAQRALIELNQVLRPTAAPSLLRAR